MRRVCPAAPLAFSRLPSPQCSDAADQGAKSVFSASRYLPIESPPRSEGIDLVDLGGYQTNVLARDGARGSASTGEHVPATSRWSRLEKNLLRRRQGRMLRGMRARALAPLLFSA
jgi:hypothetical protein